MKKKINNNNRNGTRDNPHWRANIIFSSHFQMYYIALCSVKWKTERKKKQQPHRFVLSHFRAWFYAAIKPPCRLRAWKQKQKSREKKRNMRKHIDNNRSTIMFCTHFQLTNWNVFKIKNFPFFYFLLSFEFFIFCFVPSNLR